MVYRLSLMFALVVTLLLSGCSKKEVGWPRWGGPNGDGISTEVDWDPEALAGGPEILWRLDIGGGFSNAVIRDNRLYTVGMIGVVCLNAETGEQIWLFEDGDFTDPQATPSLDGGDLYVLDKGGALFCLRAKNGKLRWKKDLVEDFNSPKSAYGYASSPVVEGNLVILNAKTSGIALNKKTGEMIWKGEVNVDTDGDYYSTPAIYNYDNKRYALVFSFTGLYSVDVETGGLLWFYEWTKDGSPNVVDPVVFDNKVFISSSETNPRGVLLNINGTKPSVVWQSKNLSNHVSTSVYIDGCLYGTHGDYHLAVRHCSLRCVDVRTAEVMWEVRMEGPSLIAADGKLIILEANGTLYIAEATPKAYREISKCNLPSESGIHKWWTPPVLYKSKIYCRNYGGDLVCIDVSKKS